MGIPIVAGGGLGYDTENAGTVIIQRVDPRKNLFSRVFKFGYKAGSTEHTGTWLREYGRTTLSAAALASQAVIALTADPGTGTTPGAIAANDYLVIEKPDGTFHTAKVSSVASLNITLTANVPTGGFDSGAVVWFFGAEGDGHPQYVLDASTLVEIGDGYAGVVGSPKTYSPLLFHSDNASNAGKFRYATIGYTAEGMISN